MTEAKVSHKIRISLSDVRALGFDTSTVHIEKMPLGHDHVMQFNLKRKTA